MGRIAGLVGVMMALAVGIAAAAGGSGDTAGRIKAAEEKAERLGAAKVGEFAADLVKGAKADLAVAQSAFTGGNDRVALQKLERAEMQLTVAEAKTASKELAEEAAVRRSELKKLEARFERFLQGEE